MIEVREGMTGMTFEMQEGTQMHTSTKEEPEYKEGDDYVRDVLNKQIHDLNNELKLVEEKLAAAREAEELRRTHPKAMDFLATAFFKEGFNEAQTKQTAQSEGSGEPVSYGGDRPRSGFVYHNRQRSENS